MKNMAKVLFIGWFENGNMFTKEVTMDVSDKDQILRATSQFAEVNKALVEAFVDDKKVFESDWRKEEI